MRSYFVVAFVALSTICFSVDSDQNDVGTFWHITDFHVDTGYIINDTSGYFGDYNRDTSTLVAFTGIEFGNDMGFAENQPDFVVWGGDAAPHNQNQTQDDVLNSLRFLSRHMQYAFDPAEVPLIPILGNYDVYPPNTMSPRIGNSKSGDWCSRLSGDDVWYIWSAYISYRHQHHPEIPSFEFSSTCYQTLIVENQPLLVVVGLNSLIWYNNNSLVNESISDPLDQFCWLNATLKAVRDLRAKAIIVTHIPVGVHELNANGRPHMKDAYNSKFTQLLREYADVITTTLAAYQHTDTFRVLLDENYKPVGTIFLGPSVDPYKLNGVGSFNPRLRQFYYNRTSGTILDYVQYYLNLSERAPKWKEEYRASIEYGTHNLTASTMAELLDEFTVEDNKGGRWGKYWNHHLGGRPHDPIQYFENGQCPEAQSVCRCQQICAMRHSEQSELNACLSVCNSQPKPRLKTIKELGCSGCRPSVGSKFTAIVIGGSIGFVSLSLLS